MFKQDVKLISRKQIIFPPHTNGNTTNYHLCESMLIADGYKPLDDSQTPPQNGTYTPYYEETADKIVRKWEKQEIPEPTYYEKRAAAYPPVTEYLDAMVKINSGDEEIIVAGQKQLAAYYEICLAVKKTFPKPETNENEEVNTNVDNN